MTLVAIAVVIGAAFIALLAMARVARAQREAREQIAHFKTALQLFAVDNGQFPTTQQGLDALIHRPTVGPTLPHWKRYLDSVNQVPKDPWGNPYVYRSPGTNGDDYFIASYGADGRSGGVWAAEDVTSLPESP